MLSHIEVNQILSLLLIVKTILRFFLKVNKEPEALTVCGKVFHGFGAEQVNELSKSAVCDNGTCSNSFSDDLKFSEWISDKGVNNSVR